MLVTLIQLKKVEAAKELYETSNVDLLKKLDNEWESQGFTQEEKTNEKLKYFKKHDISFISKD